MDYGRRDAPLQGIPERAEGVEGHRLNFDSGSEMGSEMGSRPGSGPPSPTAGARVSHLCWDELFRERAAHAARPNLGTGSGRMIGTCSDCRPPGHRANVW